MATIRKMLHRASRPGRCCGNNFMGGCTCRRGCNCNCMGCTC